MDAPQERIKITPLEKMLLIKRFKENPNTTPDDYCRALNISKYTFRQWRRAYDREGYLGLVRDEHRRGLLEATEEELEAKLTRCISDMQAIETVLADTKGPRTPF